MILVDISGLIKEAKKKEKKRKERRSVTPEEALMGSLAPVPVAVLAQALASGGGQHPEIAKRLQSMGERKGIEFRDYPKRGILRSLWSGDPFQGGQALSQPAVPGMTPEQAALPYPTPTPGTTWGDVAGKKIVWKPRSAGMLSHEMGHLEQKNPAMVDTLARLGAMGGPAMAAGGLLSSDPNVASQLGQIGALFAGATQLPRLGQEAGASIRGLRMMRGAGASRGQMISQGLTRMLPSFLGHAAKASVPVIGSLLLGGALAGLKRKTQKKKKKKKE